MATEPSIRDADDPKNKEHHKAYYLFTHTLSHTQRLDEDQKELKPLNTQNHPNPAGSPSALSSTSPKKGSHLLRSICRGTLADARAMASNL